MIQLSREIRFSLVNESEVGPITNSWAGWPATNRAVPFLVASCTLSGSPDDNTGYVCNIKRIDELLRAIVIEHLVPSFDGSQTCEQILRLLFDQATQKWKEPAEIVSVSLAASPFLKFTINADESKMICVTQQFEFSASHRLHCKEMSDEENQQLFGKCNNPNGHGHNYVVEISVTGEESENGAAIPHDRFSTTVKDLVIDQLDHKNLNKDVEYFGEVIPTVENISIAIWKWLDGKLEEAKLDRVRVYETPKTWADYFGG